MDQIELILSNFATQTRTDGSRSQEVSSQQKYSLPRLKRMWTHLSRVKAGIGMRGPGETQLEEDPRLVNHRIRDLKEKLLIGPARKAREVAYRPPAPTVSLDGHLTTCKIPSMKVLTPPLGHV